MEDYAVSAVFHHEILVSEDAIDELGHVNNAIYLVWLQQAAVAHSAANGWSVDRYRKLNAGWIARSHTIEYRQSAYAGDRLRVSTWVSGARKVVSTRRYVVTRCDDGEVIAEAETKWAFVDFEKFRPRRVPPMFWDDFEVLSEPQARDLIKRCE